MDLKPENFLFFDALGAQDATGPVGLGRLKVIVCCFWRMRTHMRISRLSELKSTLRPSVVPGIALGFTGLKPLFCLNSWEPRKQSTARIDSALSCFLSLQLVQS